MWLYMKTMFSLVSSFLEQSEAIVCICSSKQMFLKNYRCFHRQTPVLESPFLIKLKT